MAVAVARASCSRVGAGASGAAITPGASTTRRPIERDSSSSISVGIAFNRQRSQATSVTDIKQTNNQLRLIKTTNYR
jgi:hypothetical protein